MALDWLGSGARSTGLGAQGQGLGPRTGSGSGVGCGRGCHPNPNPRRGSRRPAGDGPRPCAPRPVLHVWGA
eukprot:scaffold87766_cov33-Phaeocystis_antarctica.AAC.1